MPLLPRLLGAATAAYGAAALVRPAVIAKPGELTDAAGETPAAAALLIRAVAARDLISGVSMILARDGAALRWAIAIRAASDLTDALAFGVSLPTAQARGKAAAVAGLWGALCGASALTTR